MRSRMWITTTALCLVTLFVALFAGTAQAMATDITGISASVPENTTAAGTALASGGSEHTAIPWHVVHQARMMPYSILFPDLGC